MNNLTHFGYRSCVQRNVNHKIAFVCNQNLARSQVLSAVFAGLLQNCNFDSFGLIAKENTPLPIVIESVFTDLGLATSGRVAKNMGLHRDDILGQDVILAVTSFIAEELINMGFTGRLVDLEKEASLVGIVLQDPQLMPRRECAFELSKYLRVAFSSLRKLGYFPNFLGIRAIIPGTESQIGKAFELSKLSRSESSTIIYADFIAPRQDLAKSNFYSFAEFGFRESFREVLLKQGNNSSNIFLPAHAVSSAAKMYLSAGWLQLIERLSTNLVTLITPPLQTDSGMTPETYLAALTATEVVIVE